VEDYIKTHNLYGRC